MIALESPFQGGANIVMLLLDAVEPFRLPGAAQPFLCLQRQANKVSQVLLAGLLERPALLQFLQGTLPDQGMQIIAPILPAQQ